LLNSREKTISRHKNIDEPMEQVAVLTNSGNVLGETFEFLSTATMQCADRKLSILDEFNAHVKGNFSLLVELIGRLDVFQMDQFHHLLDFHRQSLRNISDYEDIEQEGFYLSIMGNLIDDLRGYLDERDNMMKKKLQGTLDRENEKVAYLPPFFLKFYYDKAFVNHGRD
jgi:hypothetical protein